jgi:hypothetical protein
MGRDVSFTTEQELCLLAELKQTEVDNFTIIKSQTCNSSLTHACVVILKRYFSDWKVEQLAGRIKWGHQESSLD